MWRAGGVRAGVSESGAVSVSALRLRLRRPLDEGTLVERGGGRVNQVDPPLIEGG